MFLNGLHGVLAAAGIKPANRPTGQRCKQWRDGPAIKPQERQQDELQGVHLIDQRRLTQQIQVGRLYGRKMFPRHRRPCYQHHFHRHP